MPRHCLRQGLFDCFGFARRELPAELRYLHIDTTSLAARSWLGSGLWTCRALGRFRTPDGRRLSLHWMVFRLKESGTARDVLLQKSRWLLAGRMLHASALGCRALLRSSSSTELPSGSSLGGARPRLTTSDVAPRTGPCLLASCLCCGLQTRCDSPVGLVAHRRLAVTGAAASLLDAPASAVHGVPAGASSSRRRP